MDPCELVNLLFKLDECCQVVIGRVPMGRYVTGKRAPVKLGWRFMLKWACHCGRRRVGELITLNAIRRVCCTRVTGYK